MSIHNRYVQRSKISEAKFRELVRYFAADLDATQITFISGLNRNTVNRYLKAIRERIAEYCESESSLSEVVNADESFFGKRRISISACNGTDGQCDDIGNFHPSSKVCARIVPVHATPPSTKKNIIAGRLTRDGIVYAKELSSGHSLFDAGFEEFAKKHKHIKGIEGFWSLAKTRLAKFRGLNKETFYLHLKECEFRYNYRSQNLYLQILKLVRNKPLFE
jgi:transposase-like protein